MMPLRLQCLILACLLLLCQSGSLLALHPCGSAAAAEMVPSTLVSGHASYVSAVAYSPDGRTLSSGNVGSTIEVWDAASGSLLRTLSGHAETVRALAYSPDGRTLASASADNTIKVWDAASGSLLRTLSGHATDVMALAYSPDGLTLASGSYDKTIKVWDAASGRLLRTLSDDADLVKALAYSPDGRTLAACGSCTSIKVRDAASGSLLRTISGPFASSGPLACSPDGRTLAACGISYTIRLWDAASGSLLRTLSGHAGTVRALAYSPDGRTLVSGSEDKTIKVWDAASGSLLRTVSDDDAVRALAYSPDGLTLASGCKDNIKVWPLRSDDVLCHYVPGNDRAVAAAKGSNNRPSNTTSGAETEQQRQARIRARAQVIAQEDTSPGISKQNKDRPIGDKWALVIGISKFKNPTYNLHYAAKDATDFYNFLVNEAGFKRDHVLLLTNESATRENVITAFGDKFLPAVARQDDMVVVFVSTHGTPKSKDQGGRNYVVAYDTDINKLYATGVDMDELYRRVKEAVKTDRALIVMDTCYSGGGVPGAKAMAGAANFDATEIAQGSGHLVITSSSPEQRSWESKHSANGVFTKYLLESLRERNCRIDVKSAFANVQDKVDWEVKSTFGVNQVPQLGGDWEGKELILSVPATKPRPNFNTEILQLMQRKPAPAVSTQKKPGTTLSPIKRK